MRVPFTESLDKVFKANTLRPAKLLRVVPIAVAALTSQSIVLKTGEQSNSLENCFKQVIFKCRSQSTNLIQSFEIQVKDRLK